MSHIFISYSRIDLAFAQKIVDTLAANDLDTWIDWKSIPKGEDWEQEIYRGIEEADAFLFLISPDSVASEMCNKEIAHAVKNGKRILPIVIRDTDPKTIHPEISKRNWVFCRDGQDDFSKAIEETRKTIHTDYEWLKYHTELQVKALKWEQKKDNSRLLRGKELREAEQQLAEVGAQEDPQPTKIQREFILGSQRNEVRARRQVVTSLAFGLVIVAMLAIFAWVQRNTAVLEAYSRATAESNAISEANAKATALVNEENARVTAQAEKERAEEQSRIALARQLAAQAENINLDQYSASNLAGLLAVEAAHRYPSLETAQAIKYALSGLTVSLFYAPHKNYVFETAFSPDGHLVASGSSDGIIQVRDADNGALVSQMNLHAYYPGMNDLIFSPDGNRLASVHNDGTVRIWNPRTGQQLHRMEHSSRIVWAVVFSPDGSRLLSGGGGDVAFDEGGDNSVRVWDVSTGKEVLRLQHSEDVIQVHVSADGKWIVSSDQDGKVYTWNAITGEKIVEKDHDAYAQSVISPNGLWVASGGSNGKVLVWEIETGKEIARMTYGSRINDIAFSPDGRYLLTGSKNTAQVWRIASQSIVVSIVQKEDIIQLGFSPDGKYVFSTSEKFGILWDAISGNQLSVLTHEERINDFDFSFDSSKIITASFDYTARVWDISNNETMLRMFHQDAVLVLDYSPDGQFLASGSSDSSVIIWDATSGVPIYQIYGYNLIGSLDFSADGNYLAAGDLGGLAQVWSIQSGERISSKIHDGRVASIAISPDGNMVVSAGIDDKRVVVWDLVTGEEYASVDHNDYVEKAIFDLTSALVISADWSGNIMIWDATTGEIRSKLAHGNMVYDLDINDHRLLVSGGCDKNAQLVCIQGSARLWQLPSGTELLDIQHDGAVVDVAFSPDGKLLASAGSEGMVKVWNVESELQIAVLQHGLGVRSVNFSPDGKFLVTGCEDGTARVWEITTQRELIRETHTGTVYDALFSPDGLSVSSASLDGEIRIWKWRLDDLIAETCGRLQRNLSHIEWESYIGSEPYHATCPNLPIEPEITITPTP